MRSSRIVREIARDGSVVIRDSRCEFAVRRLGAGVVEVRITGADNGQFGTAIIDEIAVALFRERSLKLFVDANECTMLSASVSRAWARFFEHNHQGLERVTILATLKATALSMQIIRHLSGTGGLVHIHSDRDLYETRKAAIALSEPSR